MPLLDRALETGEPSVVALIGPGGQGKTAILQHWLGQVAAREPAVDGVFLWSFYRGKDVDLCLRELYGAVAGLAQAPDVSAGYCVDRLLPLLRARPWVVVLDGAEVVQYESEPWFGRFLHPELSRLVEELASEAQPGVTVLTTRFPLPELECRPTARFVSLSEMDPASARHLLTSLGVRGTPEELDKAATFCGRHAKAVELLGTLLVRFHAGDASKHQTLPEGEPSSGASDEEYRVGRVLAAFRAALPTALQDLLALATAFRDPLREEQLIQYLVSEPVRVLLQETWLRSYHPFAERGTQWLTAQVDSLVALRLLERVSLTLRGVGAGADATVIDAHPLVRRAFDQVLGPAGRKQSAGARAGFLHGRPDRRPAASLEEASADIELFHAYCDAGLWEEADLVLKALDRPRYRFLAPVAELALLKRFFPQGDSHRPPLWPKFRRRRDLAVCLELLGRFDVALEAYPPEDAPLRGDALIALGELGPLLDSSRPPPPWQLLWQSYRAHALCLAGRTEEAIALCGLLVPGDVYESAHVFECLLRAHRLTALDMNSFLYRPPRAEEYRWSDLGRQRMRRLFAPRNRTGGRPGPDLCWLDRSL